jgi:AraC-like DNA-binding protein
MSTFGQSISIIDLFMNRTASPSPDFFSSQVSQAQRFYLNLHLPRTTPLAVVCGGVEHCAPDYAIRRATFPFYSIEYVASGEGWLELGKHRLELHPGTVFSYGPGIRQHIISHPQKPLVKYFVDFDGTRSKRWLRQVKLAVGRAAQIYPPAEIQPLFDELIRHGRRATRHAPELCRHLLECLGLELLEARASLRGTDSTAFATYQNCRRFIEENFPHLRTLEQAALGCQVNPAYLCRLFRRFDHQSPYQFLTRLKMDAAAGRLQQPGARVKNVAADLGFTNPFHFSRVFKSVFAVAPESFRRLRCTLDNSAAEIKIPAYGKTDIARSRRRHGQPLRRTQTN